MITSTQNPLIKEIRSLRRDKAARQAGGLLVVEGIQGVVAAVQSGAEIRAIVFAPDQLTSEAAYAALDLARARGVRCEAVSAPVFASISEREHPIGILALVHTPIFSLEQLAVRPDGLYIGLHGVGDPGNLGTILRTLDAAGGAGLILSGQTVDPYHPTAVRASAGAIFAVPIAATPDLAGLLAWSRAAGLATVATSDRGPQSYWAYAYSTPCLVLMGSEAHGLPADVLAALPQVAIPMYGLAASLNLAVATALILYEIRRQRGAEPHSPR